MVLFSRRTRRWWLAAASAASLPCLYAQTLSVHRELGRLRVSSTAVQFLEGAPLARLHNGASVVFVIQLGLLANNKTTSLARSAARFEVSYDLWEEKFAVTRLATPRKTASHLTSYETEAWCLDNLTFSAAGIAPDSPFWVRLDVRPEEPNEVTPLGEDLGATLARLVDLFSRPPRAGDTRKRAEAGPFRLKDLR